MDSNRYENAIKDLTLGQSQSRNEGHV